MSALPSQTELEAERARRSLRAFVRGAWPVLEPATRFYSNWHIDAICDRLEAVERGEVRRLLINLPPRHMKSLLVSVMFLAWVWTRSPERRFLFASYAQSLAVRDSLKTRRLLESPWYRERYGHLFSLTSDQNEKARFENDRTGFRLATSPGGFATGEGGDIVVVDDPHKTEEAASDAVRETTVGWFFETMSTRINDPARGAFVLVGHRVHEADLFGRLIEEGTWEYLRLPAEHEPHDLFVWPGDRRTEAGQLLWPERFGRPYIEELKRRLGSYAAAAQFQQLPIPATGGVFERRWWRFYDPEGPLPHFETVVQSWDLTFNDKPGSDYVVGQAWGKVGARKFLLAQRRERLSFTQTITAIKQFTAELAERFPGHAGHAIIVEQAANGPAVIDALKREISGIIAEVPEGSKLDRAHGAAPQVEAGDIHLPGAVSSDGSSYDRARTPAWVQGFVEEAAAFPYSAHDDQVDAMTQALKRLNRRAPRIRVLEAPSVRRPRLPVGW